MNNYEEIILPQDEAIQALTLLAVLEKMYRLEQDIKNCDFPEVKAEFQEVYRLLYSVYGEQYEIMRPQFKLLP